MRFRPAALLTLALLFVTPAVAFGQYPEHNDDDSILGPGPWYLSASGMYLFSDDAELESVAGIPTSSFTDIELDEGWGAAVAVGRHLGSFRGEFEYSYRSMDIDSFGSPLLPSLAGDGDVSAHSLMANLVFELPLGDRLGLYAGGGAGGAYIDAEIDSTFGASSSSDEASGVVFAWQAMAGLDYAISERFDIYGGYRLWSATDLDEDEIEVDIPLVHSIEVGIRMRF